MAALEYTETPRLERALTKEELRAIARGVREVAEPTPRSIRRRACELLGREPGALDGLKGNEFDAFNRIPPLELGADHQGLDVAGALAFFVLRSGCHVENKLDHILLIA